MKTVELSLTVVPKLISDDMQISVTVDGVTAPLERNGNEFKGTIDVGLFVDYNQWPLLSINTAVDAKALFSHNLHPYLLVLQRYRLGCFVRSSENCISDRCCPRFL